jgi:hypothetical protein
MYAHARVAYFCTSTEEEDAMFFSLGALMLAMQATQNYRDDEREHPHTKTNVPERREGR